MPRATSRVFETADEQPELLGHASDEDSAEERNMISPRSPLGCTDQEIEDNVENLSAKTQWAQEQAVTKIYDLLRKHVCLDGLQQRQLSLFEGLRRIILTPKYAAKLRADAARTAAAGLLALDDVPIGTFNDLGESIIRVITDRVTPEAVVVAGLRTLLIAALLNPHADDDAPLHATTLLPVFSKFISSSANANPTIVGTAIECLSLLCGHGNVNELKNHKKILAKLVSKPMPEIVVPSAEALALLSQQGAVEDDEELQGVLDGVEAMIENLNKESIRTAHKDTRKIQRAALRRVLAQLTGESGPQEKIVVGQRTVNFQLWTQVLVIDRLRDLLGGGLPIHLMLNPRVQEMLGLDDTDLKQGKKRSKAEKALMMADLAAAAKERRLQRNQRTRQFGSVLDEE